MSHTKVVYDGTLESALKIKNLAASECIITIDGDLIIDNQKIKRGESWSKQSIRKDRKDNTRSDKNEVRGTSV